MDATLQTLRVIRIRLALSRAAISPVVVRVACAVGITLLQIILAGVASGQARPVAAWRSLYQWDAGWYANIIENGYTEPGELAPTRYCSVGFFPGYPVLAGLVKSGFGLDSPAALLITSQITCGVFWFYLLLLCRRWQIPDGLVALLVLLIAVHPGTFFLVAGYSESLFLASLVGYLYWSHRPGAVGWCLAAVHGLVMTSTRLVGLPLVALPMLISLATNETTLGRALALRLANRALLGTVAAAGAALFFGYLHWRFGQWDLYLKAQRVCWQVQPDYLALFRPKTYRLPYLAIPRLFTEIAHLNRMVVPAILASFGLLMAREFHRDQSGRRQRLALYAAAALLFFIPAAGYASLEMLGMLRYGACVHIFLVLIFAQQARACTRAAISRRALVGLPVMTFLLALQIVMIWRFTHGLVVA